MPLLVAHEFAHVNPGSEASERDTDQRVKEWGFEPHYPKDGYEGV